MGWFVIVKKSTTLVLGVTIIDKILSSMQEVMKNSSRCDRCLRGGVVELANANLANGAVAMLKFRVRAESSLAHSSFSSP